MIKSYNKYREENLFEKLNFSKTESTINAPLLSFIKRVGDLDYLNNNFTGWVSTIMAPSYAYVHIVKWRLKDLEDKLSFFIDKVYLTDSESYFNDYIELDVTEEAYSAHGAVFTKLILETDPTRKITKEDPFGEEIWENTNYELDNEILFYQLKPTKQIIKDDELRNIVKKKDIKNFNQDFSGWVKIKQKYKKYLFNVIRYELVDGYKLVFTFNEYFEGDVYKKTGSTPSTLLVSTQPEVEIQKYVVIGKNNISSEIDPHNEEDWDWDIF
jgi:hypothetical protein